MFLIQERKYGSKYRRKNVWKFVAYKGIVPENEEVLNEITTGVERGI